MTRQRLFEFNLFISRNIHIIISLQEYAPFVRKTNTVYLFYERLKYFLNV